MGSKSESEKKKVPSALFLERERRGIAEEEQETGE